MPTERLIEIWHGWEDAYRHPVGGWTGLEQFREQFERDRDAMADRVRASTPATLEDDAAALRQWLIVGGELRVATRSVDNIAEARARLLADLDDLIDDLGHKSAANSDQQSTALGEIHQSGASTSAALRESVPPPRLVGRSAPDRLIEMIARHDPDLAADLAEEFERDRRREPSDRMHRQFSRRLIELMEYDNLRNDQVAGFDAKTISRYRHSDRPDGRMPPHDRLVELATALRVSTAFFLEDDPTELYRLRRHDLPRLNRR